MWREHDVLIGAGTLALAALGAVAAEAPWRGRRWAYRASVALAVAYACDIFVECMMNERMSGLAPAAWVMIPSALLAVPLLAYIRGRSEALFGPATPPRRRPRP